MRSGFRTQRHEATRLNDPEPSAENRALQRQAWALGQALAAAAEANDQDETMRLAVELAQVRLRLWVPESSTPETSTPAVSEHPAQGRVA